MKGRFQPAEVKTQKFGKKTGKFVGQFQNLTSAG